MKKIPLIQYKLKQTFVLYILMGLYALRICCEILSPYSYYEEIWERKGLLDGFLFIGTVAENCIYFTHAVLLLGVAIAMLSFRESSHRETDEFIRSLPYKRRQIWNINYFIGFGWISVLFLLIFLATVISYQMNWQGIHETYLQLSAYETFCKMDSLGNASIIILYYWIICICIYSLAVFARVIMHNILLSLLTFFGILGIPYVILNVVAGTSLDSYFIYAADILLKVEISDVLYPDRDYCYPILIQLGESGDYQIVAYFLPDPEVMLLWLALAVLFLLLAYGMARSEKDTGRIARNMVYENIFLVGIGVYTASITLYLSAFTDTERQTMTVVLLVVFLLVELLLYYFVKGRGKYDYLNAKEGNAS